MTATSKFLFATCQIGAETALKREMARVWPEFRFAYSRPGFLTFKIPAGASPPDNLDLRCAFARAHGLSIGKAAGSTIDERIRQVWELAAPLKVEEVHVWPRDAHEPGARDYEPGMTAATLEIADAIRSAAPRGNPATIPPSTPQSVGRSVDARHSGHLALDVVLVEEQEWWVGYHRVHSTPSGWPGGFFPEPLPADAVSRVYLKMLEAIRWAGFRIGPGQRVVEIGCAPGGASQALLNLGAKVVGVDPAEMHPLVLGHPRFRHIRRRSKEVRRHEFLDTDWLTCDINLRPNYTLDTVEAIVKYPGVRLQGMLLTLKMIEWSMADDIPAYLDRIRGWGFREVAVRQLHHNRREVCVAACDYQPVDDEPAAAGSDRGAGAKRRPSRKGLPARQRRKTPPNRPAKSEVAGKKSRRR